jgi:RHS repeat-associated protein
VTSHRPQPKVHTIRYNPGMRSEAAKGRKLFSLAAALLVCLALAAPTAEASRYLPGLASSAAAPALPPFEALDQVDPADAVEPFPLLTDEDAQLLAALALLDAPEIARLTAEKRLRPLADPGEIPRPVELAAIRKLASGVSTCWTRLNIWETGGLSQNCIEHAFQGLWTDPSTGIAYARNRWLESRTASWLSEDPLGAVDSPNLYAFVGWGPQAGRDPLGMMTPWINDLELGYVLRQVGIDPAGDLASAGEAAVDRKVTQLTELTRFLPGDQELYADTLIYAGGEATKEVIDVLRFGQGIEDAAYGEGFWERTSGALKDTGRAFVVAGLVSGASSAGKKLVSKADDAVIGLRRFGGVVRGWFKKEGDDVAQVLSHAPARAPSTTASMGSETIGDGIRMTEQPFSPSQAIDEFEEGTFSLTEHAFSDYPEVLPRPEGTFRLLEGTEKEAARQAANRANKAQRRANPAAYAGKEIHEIKPVKFSGSPTDLENKIALDAGVHRREVTPWWNRLMRALTGD